MKGLVNELKIPISRILVVVDELNFEINRIDLKQGKANGSGDRHNGLKSIHAALGVQDYWRLRLGVGTRPADTTIVEWVLSKVPDDDQSRLLDSQSLRGFLSLFETFRARQLSPDGPDRARLTQQLQKISTELNSQL